MYLKLQYCVSCAIHGKIVRYVKQELSNGMWPVSTCTDYVAVSDLVKVDETVHHLQELGTTRTERRSTHSKPLRPPKFVQVERFLSEVLLRREGLGEDANEPYARVYTKRMEHIEA